MKSKFDNFYQEINLSKQQAIQLSSPQQLQFPQPTKTNTLFCSLASYFPFKLNTNRTYTQQIIPIPNEFLVLYSGNFIKIYQYQHTAADQVKCQLQNQTELPIYVKCIKVAHFSKYKKDSNFYLVAEDESCNYLLLLCYDPGKKKIENLGMKKIGSFIYCWSFIQTTQILIWCENMKIYHYQLKNTGLKYIQSTESGVNIKAENKNKTDNKKAKGDQEKSTITFSLHFSSIIGRRQKQQDSIIVLFYILYSPEINAMRIKCKQIRYPLENFQIPKSKLKRLLSFRNSEYPQLEALQKNHQILSQNTATPQILKVLNIFQIDDSFFIRFEYEIVVIQKRYNQYYIVDNIYKKTRDCSISVAFNTNIVTCISGSILEMNKIVLHDHKVNSEMVDFLDLKLEYESMKREKTNEKNIEHNFKIIQLWISTNLCNDKPVNHFLFVFELENKSSKETQIILFVGKDVERIKKLTKLAHSGKSFEKVEKIERLGIRLGVSSSQFYYHMWRNSDQSSQSIVNYLLKCRDYKKILSQLKNFLKKQYYPIGKLLKVLHRLQDLALDITKQSLCEETLLDYFHILFIHRKFKIFEANYKIDKKQFIQMVEISLFDLSSKIIDQHINPVVKTPSLWISQARQPPKINIIQILDLFKLPLLEQYHRFLRELLMKYPENMIQVIKAFPELLPIFPFQQIQIIPTNNIEGKSILRVGQKQHQFFSAIKQQQLKSQPNFLEHALKQLYPFYSTSIILKKFQQTLKRHQMNNQKYIFHSVIQSNYEEFITKIGQLSENNGTYLYCVALDCLIKAAHARDQYAEIEQMCNIFKQSYQIDKELLDDIEIASKLYELMINNSIVESSQYELHDIFSQPIEKWIALFFLGNKQQADFIFTDFMKIFQKNKDQFILSIKNFISSEHCSKIELCILMDMIQRSDKNFQKQNQKIIEVIIDGFFARVEVSQITDGNHFYERLLKVQLCPQLLIKADKIEKMNLCKRILSAFGLEQILLKDLLQNTIKIFDQMVEIYFNGQLIQNRIIISVKENKQMLIEQSRQMFELLYFMKQNIFFHISTEELIIAYCKKLITWQQFDEVHYIFYESSYVKKGTVDLRQVISTIQSEILQELYQMENFYYNEQNKQFVRKLLQIDVQPSHNQIVIEEQAKIEISDLFMKWGIKITMAQIDQMCKKWKNQQNSTVSNSVMQNIIQDYATHLNLKSFENIYRCFMIATLHITEFEEDELRSEDFYKYCTHLSDALLINGKLKQASQIICVVNEMFEMNYMLMAECLLKSLIQIYCSRGNQSEVNFIKVANSEMESNDSGKYQEKLERQEIKMEIDYSVKPTRKLYEQFSVQSQEIIEEDSPIEVAKKYIDLFVLNWQENNEDGMRIIFGNYFNIDLSKINHPQEFDVHPDLSFSHLPKKIDSYAIWDFICDQCKNYSILESDMVPIYFFFRMGLSDPHMGFSQIDYISVYNHLSIAKILQQFKCLCQGELSYKNSINFNFLNYYVIFEKYLDGLTKLLIIKHQQIIAENYSTLNKSFQIHFNNDNSFMIPKNANFNLVRQQLLKNSTCRSDPVGLSINKMKYLTEQAKKNKEKRQAMYNQNHSTVKRFDLSVKQFKMTLKKSGKGKRNQERIDQNQQIEEEDEQIMMSFDRFKKIKNCIKNDDSVIGDENITERVIIQQILSEEKRRNSFKVGTDKKQRPELKDLVQISIRKLESSSQSEKEKSQPEQSEED